MVLLTRLTMDWHSSGVVEQGPRAVRERRNKGINVGVAIFVQAEAFQSLGLLKESMEYFRDLADRAGEDIEEIKKSPDELAKFQLNGLACRLGMYMMDKAFFGTAANTITILTRRHQAKAKGQAEIEKPTKDQTAWEKAIARRQQSKQISAAEAEMQKFEAQSGYMHMSSKSEGIELAEMGNKVFNMAVKLYEDSMASMASMSIWK
jgi:hypothetical protein